MIPCQGTNSLFGLIQSYWITWLVISFIGSIVLGEMMLRNWESTK